MGQHQHRVLKYYRSAKQHHRVVLACSRSVGQHHRVVSTYSRSVGQHHRVVFTYSRSVGQRHRVVLTCSRSVRQHHRIVPTCSRSVGQHHRINCSAVFQVCGTTSTPTSGAGCAPWRTMWSGAGPRGTKTFTTGGTGPASASQRAAGTTWTVRSSSPISPLRSTRPRGYCR